MVRKMIPVPHFFQINGISLALETVVAPCSSAGASAGKLWRVVERQPLPIIPTVLEFHGNIAEEVIVVVDRFPNYARNFFCVLCENLHGFDKGVNVFR